MRNTIIRTASLLTFLAAWWLFAALNSSLQWVPPVMIPTPLQILESGWDMRNLVPGDVAISMFRVFLGFLIAAVLGVFLGCLTGSSRLAENIFDPIFEVLRPIPPLAFLPIFIIWFGLGEASKVLMIAYSAFFIIYMNTYQGVRYADPLLMRAALSLGASKGQAFFRISLPSAMPEIFTGMRLGIGMAFFVLVAAELIAADSGMGFRIQEARYQFRVDRMFFGAALIGTIGFILFASLKFAETKLLAWKPKREAH